MVVVVKIGGDVLRNALPSGLASEIKRLHEGEGVIVVHGGADIVTEIAQRMGKEQKFVTSPEGFRSRLTDAETLEIFAMVTVGLINKRLVSELAREGVRAFGLSGVDGELLQAKRKERIIILDERGRRRIVNGGYTGRITRVSIEILNWMLREGFVPVVSPLALGEKFEMLDVDSDRAAAHIAGAVKARAVVFLTDVQGVLVGGEIKRELVEDEAERLLPSLTGGMKMKVFAALEALKMGAGEAVIASVFEDRCISRALEHSIGTWIHG